jgi:PAS domain S-box-containing protein
VLAFRVTIVGNAAEESIVSRDPDDVKEPEGPTDGDDVPARPRLGRALVVSALGIAATMGLYETAKTWVHPDISIVESHVATIVFSTLAGGAAVFVVLRRRQRLVLRLLAEIAAHRRAAADLEQANSLLMATLDATTDGILVLDTDRRVRAHNGRLLALWRLDPPSVASPGLDTALLDKVRQDVKAPDAVLAAVEELHARPEAEHRALVEFTDGRALQWHSSPQRVGGRVVGLVWSFRDVADERKAQQTIQMLAHTLRSIGECVSITDTSDTLLFVNQAFAVTYGYHEEELIGRHISMVGSPRTRPEIARAILPATLAGGWRGELWNRRKDGTDFPIWLTTAIVHDETGTPIALVGVARDMTEQKRTQDSLRRARESESIVTLAGGIAHQFNNLLQTIFGHASLALDEAPPGSPLREGLHGILHASERAANLTAQLIAYSGQRVFRPVEVDVNQVVLGQVPRWRHLVPSPERLRTVLAPALPFVMADRPQVEQLLTSLVMNASEAVGDGPGGVTVRTDLVTLGADDDRFSHVSGEPLAAGTYVCLEVEDEGPGMDERTLARVFDPFFSTKFLGRGLGLPAVLGIARAHGGGLEVVSAPGRGTAIRVVIPVEPIPEPASPDTNGPAAD